MRAVESRPLVLVIGPGRKVRGGITSVILSHASSSLWTEWNCRWLETYDDRSAIHKILRACIALLVAPFEIAAADIIHIHLAAATSAARKLPFARLAVMLRKPLVLHFHAPSKEMLFEHTPRWVLDSMVRRAAVVVALSPFWRDEFRRHWPGKRIEVVPNPVPRSVCSSGSKRPGSVLYVGKLEPRKGYDVLLRSFARVAAVCPHAKLWFAGHGQLAQAAALARKLNIEQQVEFFGSLNRRTLEQKLLEAEVFCLPSYAEGMPMSMLEAMAYGLPILTTGVGGIPDMIRDGENGMLVPPGDPEALAESLIELLKSSELRAALGAEAKRSVDCAYDSSQVGDLLTAIYESLMPSTGVRLCNDARRSTAQGTIDV